MKKYGKETYKTLQIRLSEKEYAEIISFIKGFKKTRREFILAVFNDLKNYKIIRNNGFWMNDKDFAYSEAREKYQKEYPEHCVLCNDKYRKGNEILNGHHYKGYEGNNAFKVKYVCTRCHGFCHRKQNDYQPWELVVKNHKKWDGKTKIEVIEEYIKNHPGYEYDYKNIPEDLKELLRNQ